MVLRESPHIVSQESFSSSPLPFKLTYDEFPIMFNVQDGDTYATFFDPSLLTMKCEYHN